MTDQVINSLPSPSGSLETSSRWEAPSCQVAKSVEKKTPISAFSALRLAGKISTSGSAIKLSVPNGGSASAGWQFSLPSAAVYTSITFQVQAKTVTSVPANSIAVQDFSLDSCHSTSGGWDYGCFTKVTGIGNFMNSKAWYTIRASASNDHKGRVFRGAVFAAYGTTWVYATRVKVTYQVLQ